jgi:hypothetical protein
MSKDGKTPKPTPNSLEAAVRRELGVELDKGHQTADWGGELSPTMLEYAATDARVLLPLARVFESKVTAAGLAKVRDIEHRALRATAWMAGAGIPFDAEGWRQHLRHVEIEVNRLDGELSTTARARPGGGAWNWKSPSQVKEAFALLGVALPDTKEETLSRCEHPLAELLLEYRKASKTVSQFGPKLLGFVRGDSRIYPDWRQIGTETGRMSCSRPNAQQLPPEVRRFVRAPEGRALITADYAQAEIRVLAAASSDPTLIEALGPAETRTRPRRRACSASRRKRSPTSSAPRPRWSTSASSLARAPTRSPRNWGSPRAKAGASWGATLRPTRGSGHSSGRPVARPWSPAKLGPSREGHDGSGTPALRAAVTPARRYEGL